MEDKLGTIACERLRPSLYVYDTVGRNALRAFLPTVSYIPRAAEPRERPARAGVRQV